jgi:hypothetical protein
MKIGGFTEAGLDRLRSVLSAHVEKAAMPGLIALVAREGGDAHVEVIGTGSFDDPEPLSRRAIFRIASLSKPVAAAAAMVLVDHGVLALGDPVTEWLPELAGQRVLRRIDGALDDTVPARRPITLDDPAHLPPGIRCRHGTGGALSDPGRRGGPAAQDLGTSLASCAAHTGPMDHPVHPAGDDLSRPTGGGGRLLERRLRRPRRLRQLRAGQVAGSRATTGSAGRARLRWAPGRTMVAAASASLMVRASADAARATPAEARKAA